MDIEARVARHYGHGRLRAAILEAMRGRPEDAALRTVDLAPLDDDFHLGGHAATVELARDSGLEPGIELLDLGSGLGGPARYFAETHGCRVLGIDLSEELVQVANELTGRCRLDGLVRFVRASALAVPFPSERFDVVTLIHAGMNIASKTALVSEVRRVSKRGGLFVVYDVMRLDAAALPYPLPWADDPETSFVETPDSYRRLLEAHGYRIERERNRRDAALALGRVQRARGTPPLGWRVLMGPAAAQRFGNVMNLLERGSIAPIEIVARAPRVGVSAVRESPRGGGAQ